MHKYFHFASFFVLSIFWMNISLHAVGGEGVEEIPDHVIKSKGILKIQRKDGEIGTAVLFKEGNGQLGLSAKHVFDGFSLKDNPIVASLGTQQQKIVKVYYPGDRTDLVLFILEKPFEDVDKLPRLPDTGPTNNSIYKGHLYGYGGTTASPSHAPIANSSGKCRTGQVIVADFHQLDIEAQKFLSTSNLTDFSLNNIMFGFSPFQNSKVLCDEIELDDNGRFDKSLLDQKYIPLKNSSLSPNHLTYSPCYTGKGDSGGPLISEDNQLYAISHTGNHHCQCGISSDPLATVLPQGESLKGRQIFYQGEVVTFGFVPNNNSTLYMGFSSLTSRNLLQRQVVQLLVGKVRNYYMEEDTFFQNVVEHDGNFANWLRENHLYYTNYFVSIVQQRPWVERVMPIAFKYVTENLQ